MSATALHHAPPDARSKALFWMSLLEPVLAQPSGHCAALKALAREHGLPLGTLERKFYLARSGGLAALIDRRACGPRAWNTAAPSGLCPHDRDLLALYVERNQRKSTPAIRALLRDWATGKISTPTPIDIKTGYPRGWSESNLLKNLPNRFELQIARHGPSAAASERRLVYTTRANLWVGSHYLFDDIWHDNFVNNLDTRQAGRPLEFHALDLFSACKFAWGMRVRTEGQNGKMEHLKEADMRFLLACVLGTHGYSQRGTTLVVERGTAAIREDVERILHEESNGLIQVARGGMDGAAAAAHQYAGRAKGNFRFKAALETLGNLIHNELAALPGQTGMDRDHRPEQLHGLLKENDALLLAISQLPTELAEQLHWPLLTIQQFRHLAGQIYARLNARSQHELEGWDSHYTPDPRTGLMRRLSPQEVWSPGARQLVRLRPESIALILLQDQGVELTTRRQQFELRDAEISGDLLRFDARLLKDREKFLCVLNPYDPSALHVFDARGRFVTACPRIWAVDRGDLDAVHRECGAAAKAFTEAVTPYRARHAKEARDLAAARRHNAEILGRPATEKPLSKATATRIGRESGDIADFLPAEEAALETSRSESLDREIDDMDQLI